MEPINLSEPTANTSVHAPRGKGAQARTATALFDRLMAQSRPLAVNGGDVAATTEIQPNSVKSATTDTAQQDTDSNPALLALLADQQTAAASGTALRAPEAEPVTDLIAPQGGDAGKVAVDALPEAVANAIAKAAPQETTQETLVAETVSVPVAEDIGTDPTVPLPSKAMTDDTPTDQAADTVAMIEDEGQDPVEQDSTADKGVEKPAVDTSLMPQVQTVVTTPEVAPEAKADATDMAQQVPQKDAQPIPVAAPVVAAAQPAPQTAAVNAPPRTVDGPAPMRTNGRPSQAQQTAAPAQGQPVAVSAPDTPVTEATSKEAPEFTVTAKEPHDAPVQRTPRGPQMARAEQIDVTQQATAAPVQQTTVTPVTADPVVQTQTDTTATEPLQETAQTQNEPIDTRDAGWVDTMATQIEASFTETGGDIEIALTPDNLGSVRVRMEIRDGAAQVTIVTETQDAARLFQQNENRLSEMLSKNGLTLTGQDAGTGQRRDGQAGGSAQSGGFGNGSNGRGGDDDTGAETQRTRITNNLVNIIA